MITINNQRQNLISHSSIKNLVSDRLKDKRRKLGITLYEVSNDTNISIKEIQRIETVSKTATILPKLYLIKNND